MVRGNLIVVSGFSGSGKTTICRQIANEDSHVKYSISYTTRPKRPQEVDGGDYYFVSTEAFKAMSVEFLEWAEVYGNYYGTHRHTVVDLVDQGHDVIMDIDTIGAANVHKNYPEAVLIFILPPSITTLKERLVKRGQDSLQQIDERISHAAKEIQAITTYHYVVFNEQLDQTVRDIHGIVRAERFKQNRQMETVQQAFAQLLDGVTGWPH